jgi:hypothetical protein
MYLLSSADSTGRSLQNTLFRMTIHDKIYSFKKNIDTCTISVPLDLLQSMKELMRFDVPERLMLGAIELQFQFTM